MLDKKPSTNPIVPINNISTFAWLQILPIIAVTEKKKYQETDTNKI
jgi:hypothetical protein